MTIHFFTKTHDDSYYGLETTLVPKKTLRKHGLWPVPRKNVVSRTVQLLGPSGFHCEQWVSHAFHHSKVHERSGPSTNDGWPGHRVPPRCIIPWVCAKITGIYWNPNLLPTWWPSNTGMGAPISRGFETSGKPGNKCGQIVWDLPLLVRHKACFEFSMLTKTTALKPASRKLPPPVECSSKCHRRINPNQKMRPRTNQWRVINFPPK